MIDIFGLSEKNISEIKEILKKFPEIKTVVIFGSRSMGNYRPGSDVDMVIDGENVNLQTVLRFSSILNEESSLPFFFDVLSMRHIENRDLMDHILKYGKNLF